MRSSASGASGGARYFGIDERINWIGIGAIRHDAEDEEWRGSLLTFEHFLLFEKTGENLWEVAPRLAFRMYMPPCPRLAIEFTIEEEKEIKRILAMAKGAPPSQAWFGLVKQKCPPKRRSRC
jgi:hypothetical protein